MGRHKDLTDSATQALLYLRHYGLARSDAEEREEKNQSVMHRSRSLRAVYPC